MLDIKEYLKQTKTVLLTQDAFDELMQRASAQPEKRTQERTETHACDCISRQAAIDSICRTVCDNPEICESPCDEIKVLETMPSAQPVDEDTNVPVNDLSGYSDRLWKAAYERGKAEAQAEIVWCKDCNKASKCYGDVVMRSRGGGNIYCPLEFCSEAERRTDERPDRQTRDA